MAHFGSLATDVLDSTIEVTAAAMLPNTDRREVFITPNFGPDFEVSRNLSLFEVERINF